MKLAKSFQNGKTSFPPPYNTATVKYSPMRTTQHHIPSPMRKDRLIVDCGYPTRDILRARSKDQKSYFAENFKDCPFEENEESEQYEDSNQSDEDEPKPASLLSTTQFTGERTTKHTLGINIHYKDFTKQIQKRQRNVKVVRITKNEEGYIAVKPSRVTRIVDKSVVALEKTMPLRSRISSRLIIRNADDVPEKPVFTTEPRCQVRWVEESAYLVECEKEGEKYRQRYEILMLPYAYKVIFQHSTYKNRPPTVFFPYPTCAGKKRPMERTYAMTQPELGDRYLGFSVSENTQVYKCVCKALKYAGFKIAKGNSWNVLWSGASRMEIVAPLHPLQKTNHFPGIFQIGRKDNLWRNINRLKRIHGKEYSICPATYVLPEDLSRFIREKDAVEGQIWIVKPQASSCGRGIKLLGPGSMISIKEGYVASRYISNPHLIDGYKYDLRIYVLVTSFDPLVIYMYKDGLVRFATEKYTTCSRSLNKRYVHLTNYSVNKFSDKYVENNFSQLKGADLKPSEISKWSFAMLKAKYASLQIPVDYVFKQIKDVIIKALISIEPHVCAKISKTRTAPHQCFDLFGFDILVDSTLKPWLLEVNMCPSLSSSAKLDKQIKTALLSDVFQLIGVQAFPHSEPMMGFHQGPPKTEIKANFNPYFEDITEGTVLSDRDVDMLISFDEELERAGENMDRIFPLEENWENYVKYFECGRYNNFLLWRYLSSEYDILEKHRLYTNY